MDAQPCCSTGCKHYGYWVPVLVLGTTRSELNIFLCEYHRTAIKLVDLLSDRVWDDMTRVFADQGKLMPPRANIELDFRHLAHGFYC